MSRLQVTVKAMQASLDVIAANAVDSQGSLRAMALQIAALGKVVDRIGRPPQPDGEGWIARPTLG